MNRKELVALILAGGQGSRLGVLTKSVAKPALPFGGKYRIIDFTLSNCINSGVDAVGVLTQYQPLLLNSYIGIGKPWDLDRMNGGVTILPPFIKGKRGEWYKGTANAIFQNMNYIKQYNPEYVLILSGDHIYKMDYGKMLEYHKSKKASVTIGVIEVPWEEASRFGIMNTDGDNRIVEFDEKPPVPKSNLASMGIYLFNWPVLKKFLMDDNDNPHSSSDFGKNIIPAMVGSNDRVYAYPFKGYWKDVGTIYSLWEANMDLLEDEPGLNLYDHTWKIYSKNPVLPPHYISNCGRVERSIISQGCIIDGLVQHSVIFTGVKIGKKSVVRDSVIMPGTEIGDNVEINKSIIGEDVKVGNYSRIGYGEETPNQYQPDIYNSGITVIGENVTIEDGTVIGKNVMVDMTVRSMQHVESGMCVTKAVIVK